MKILISAYACEPDKGSEPEAGWEWVAAARRISDSVTVLTRSNNREAIEARLGRDVPGFVYFDLGKFWLWLKRRAPFGTQAYYFVWQLSARRTLKQLHRIHSFDVTHHLTFAVDWMPIACRIPGVPLVWGPVGGATGLPWTLWRSQGWAGLRRELAREIFSRCLRRVFGFRVARKAAVVLVQNFDELHLLGRHAPGRVFLEPNVVIDPDFGKDADALFLRASARERVAVFVGRLIPHKGLKFAIEALALPSARDWRLVVVGEGPEQSSCAELARRLGVTDRVSFVGRRARAEVGAALRKADAMLAPSMYEGSGFAVAEAITVGCPVVATNRGGPAAMVEPGTGLLVAADRRLSEHLADALGRLPGRTKGSSRWTASRLDRFLAEIYQQALAPSSRPSPDNRAAGIINGPVTGQATGREGP